MSDEVSASIKIVKDDWSDYIKRVTTEVGSGQGAGARTYPLYQKLQTERFMSEGASEGTPWASLSEPYKTRKLREYGGGDKRGGGQWDSYPGSGTKTMIATSTLAGAVIGPGSPFVSEGIAKHRALFTSTSMEISVELSGENAAGKSFTDYPIYADEKRPVMDFSEASIEEIQDALSQFLL